ncbi:hypothetical protein [Hyalangium rubrum]|uniref:Lipase n=1 Tax=Hyalangium rubrum TaxID=3103134 RepID=A0ABU5HB94_9BACT|nr:hypothetical protein [Hyalangium sp. s54d21]MDY7230067.1 hypothetical protein [Hyalangium sp. s54d21]
MKKLLLVGAMALGGASCAPDIKQDEPANFVIAQFDPAAETPVVPTPNDLAINQDTGLVNAPINPSASAAEQEFTRDYLNTLNGFPTSAPATAKLVDLDPATINENTVLFIDLLKGTAIAKPEVTPKARVYNEETDTLAVLAPDTGWSKGGQYAIALIGGESGLKGKNGKPVVGSAVWAFVTSEEPLVTCEDLTAPDCRATTGIIPSDEEDPAARIADQTASALQLERLRRSYKDVLDGIANTRGVARKDIVLMWTFTIMNQPELTFDPAKSVIPFPNDILRRPSGNTATLDFPELPADASELQKQLFAGLETLDGFSTTAPIVSENGAATGAIDVGSKLDPNTLGFTETDPTKKNVNFVKLTPGGTAPNVTVCFNCTGTATSGPQQLQFVPLVPLDEKSQYAVYMTTALKDERGRQVAPAGAFALARLANPLVADGKSTVSALTDEQALGLEPLRAGLKPLIDGLVAQGLPRSKIALAWAFTTQSTVSTLQTLHAIPSVLPAQAMPDSPTYLVEITTNFKAAMQARGLPTGNLGKIFEGQIIVPFALTNTGGTLNPDATKFRFDRIPFLLALPAATLPQGSPGYPVTIFSHGLTGNRNNALAIINGLAGAGQATVAIDTVFHGERTSCVGLSAAAGQKENNGTLIDTPDKACANAATQRCETSPTSPSFGRCVATEDTFRASCGEDVRGPIPGDVYCGQQGQGRCMADAKCEGGSFKLNPDTNAPYISGWNLLNLTNLFATRDNFRQHTIDHAQLTRVLAGSGIDAALADKSAGPIDGDKINYLGQSLGSIVGPLFTSVSPSVKNAVFNVPGGDLTGVLMTSGAFATQRNGFLAALAANRINVGTPEFDQFLGLAKMILDPADPLNYAYQVENGTVPASRQALFHYITDDEVLPNTGTQLLIRAANERAADKKDVSVLQVSSATPPVEMGKVNRHGFLLNFVDPAVTAEAQTKAITFLSTGALP